MTVKPNPNRGFWIVCGVLAILGAAGWVAVALKRPDRPGAAPPGAAEERRETVTAPRGGGEPVATCLADLTGKVGAVVTVRARVKEATMGIGDFLAGVPGGEKVDGFTPVVVIGWGDTDIDCAFHRSKFAPDWYLTLERGREVVVRGKLTFVFPGMATLKECEFRGYSK